MRIYCAYSIVLCGQLAFAGALPKGIISSKVLHAPPGYEKLRGSNILEANTKDGRTFLVPPLVGRNPSDPEIFEQFLKNFGFTYVVVGYQKSQTMPKGSVISQDPDEYAHSKTQGEIKVILSLGK